MTIRRNIDAAALNARLSNLEQAISVAPRDLYDDAKTVRDLVSEAAEDLMRNVRAAGFRADNCDLIREVEAVIYGYIAASNHEPTFLTEAEGFGEHSQGPAGDRVIAQARRDAEFICAFVKRHSA